MRKRIGSVFMGCGILFLIASMALLFYNAWENKRAGETSASIQMTLLSIIEEKQSDNTNKLVNDEEEDALIKFGIDTDEANETVEIDGYDYIGILTIPSLNLELPIMKNWSYAGMKTAPGRYAGAISTDDLVICGHNYTYHFGNLKYLETGDEIYFTDIDGNIFYYEVEEIVILQPEDIEEMVSKNTCDWDLTLFTCTVGGQTRVTVRCVRIDEDFANEKHY